MKPNENGRKNNIMEKEDSALSIIKDHDQISKWMNMDINCRTPSELSPECPDVQNASK